MDGPARRSAAPTAAAGATVPPSRVGGEHRRWATGEATMQRYRNLDGQSGVLAYDCGEGWIRIRFVGGETYEYTDAATGAEHVRNMQVLATAGEGLATYVSKFVHDAYARKL